MSDIIFGKNNSETDTRAEEEKTPSFGRTDVKSSSVVVVVQKECTRAHRSQRRSIEECVL